MKAYHTVILFFALLASPQNEYTLSKVYSMRKQLSNFSLLPTGIPLT